MQLTDNSMQTLYNCAHVIFYLDGATTGQFSALSIEALKFSLGIFTRKARQKDHMWRILGYIPQVTHHKSRGRRIAIDSNHVGSVMAHPDALNDEGNQPATEVEDVMLSQVFIDCNNHGAAGSSSESHGFRIPCSQP